MSDQSGDANDQPDTRTVETPIGDELPAHERHFVQVLSGTINEDEDRLPSPVWHWMHTCEPRGEAA